MKASAMRGSRIQAVPAFDERPGAARDHAERDEHEAEAHGVGDQVVERRRAAAGA